MKRLVFTVTNELVYDQRMLRICGSLSRAGYHVQLVGRKYRTSPPLLPRNFEQKRIRCFFKKGFGFYAEFSVRLFFYLLFQKMDLICAIDLDTIIPCYLVSVLRGKKRVYDAHELFCEMKEVVTRPRIYRFWKRTEKFTVPRFKNGYTVNEPIRDIFLKEYRVHYQVVRNLPLQESQMPVRDPAHFILYQGAVNEGRSFETLIPAFQYIQQPFWIYGDGNFYDKAVMLVQQYNLQHKVFFKGKLSPEALKEVTATAILGITLFENNGLSNYLSLANRFFDYIQAGIPQLCVDYPAYSEINKKHQVAVLIQDLSPENIAGSINDLLRNQQLYETLQLNCLEARKELNWQQEEKELLGFYENLFRDLSSSNAS